MSEIDSVPRIDLLAADWQRKWRLGYTDEFGQFWKRHEHQIPPDTVDPNWRIWLLLAGRGAGKTRTAAEWTGWNAWLYPRTRSLVSAPTSGDIRDTCIEGDSGLLSVIPKKLVENYNRSLHEITLVNGSLIKGIPASEPERFRGPQFHRAWADELAAWEQDQASFDMMSFGLRLGKNPQLVITTTPKPKRLITQLVKDSADPTKHVYLTRASTYSNLKYLAPTFRDAILKYKGTKLGRQEIDAEVIDPEEAGIIQRSWLRLWPHDKPLPEFSFVLVSLDTAFTEQTYDRKKGEPDYTACVVMGMFEKDDQNHILILDTWQERIGMPELIRRAKAEMAIEYGDLDKPVIKGPAKHLAGSGKKPDLILIEDKGSGTSLRQMLAKEEVWCYAYNPGKAKKLDRLHAVSHIFAHGHVWVVESEKNLGQPKSWYEEMIAQLCTYSGEGSIEHDDSMDACVQGVRYMADKGFIVVSDPERYSEPEYVAPVRNPYAS